MTRINADETFSFILTSVVRRPESVAVEIDAGPCAAPVSRKRSLHVSRGDELFRTNGTLPRFALAVRNRTQTRRRRSTALALHLRLPRFEQVSARYDRSVLGCRRRRDHHVCDHRVLGRLVGVCRSRARTQSHLGRSLANVLARTRTHDRYGRTRRLVAGVFRGSDFNPCRVTRDGRALFATADRTLHVADVSRERVLADIVCDRELPRDGRADGADLSL